MSSPLMELAKARSLCVIEEEQAERLEKIFGADEVAEAVRAKRPLINVEEALVAGGLREQKSEKLNGAFLVPRLGFAPSNAEFIVATQNSSGYDIRGRQVHEVKLPITGYQWPAALVGQVLNRTRGKEKRHRMEDRWIEARAGVPRIPLGLIRKHGMDAAEAYTLWEVEQWDLDERVVPIDPFLLRHLAGSLYEIVDAWELTEFEAKLIGQKLL